MDGDEDETLTVGGTPEPGWTSSMEGEPPIGMLPSGRLLEAGEDYDDEAGPQSRRRAKRDSKPRTLYVRRDLLNADELVAWAKDEGLEVTVPANKMHVTIAFSRTPVDWIKMGQAQEFSGEANLTVGEGGPRVVEALGPRNAVVLMFSSSQLCWRHEAMKREGASWDWPEYQPHVSISFGSDEPGQQPPDLSEVTPYRGELMFGPEIFEEVQEDWAAGVQRRD